MRTFAERVVVVTGAGSGIGRALALETAARGARVAVSDWDADGLAGTVAALTAAGADVHEQVLDVRDRSAVEAYADAVRAHFGRVDCVVNNAGVTYTGPVTELEYDDFHWLMDVNFWGVVHGTTAFLPDLVASGDGHLVNLSSLFGLVAVPGQSTYNAAKFAVRGFTEAVRGDLLVAGHPVHVTCVHPGGVRTGIARHGRVTPGESHERVSSTFDGLARMAPERAADLIARAVLRNRRRLLVGLDAHAVRALAGVLGAHYQDLVARSARRVMPPAGPPR